MSIIEGIQNKLNQGEYVAGPSVNLKKAFNVDHDILINKLKHYGVRGEQQNNGFVHI